MVKPLLMQVHGMDIGVPTEIKEHEYRVGLIPSAVKELCAAGHTVRVQQGAGLGIGCTDDEYEQAGALIVADSEDVYSASELLVKVKEPQAGESERLCRGQTLFTYLHLAAAPKIAEALLTSGVTAIAYETVTAADGSLPLLTPMSEVAGRMSIQAGALCLQNNLDGVGLLLSGVPGVAPARVVILGGGVAGSSAARMAVGLRANVTILDVSIERLRTLDREFGGRVTLLHSTRDALERAAMSADLVIGAVLIPGATAPKLIDRALLRSMRRGSAIVDIAIDQGGCVETSRPTTHAAPTFVEEGVVHYCVANMPGAVARTSTFALNAATLPLVTSLANEGIDDALARDPHLAKGINVRNGRIEHPMVAAALEGRI